MLRYHEFPFRATLLAISVAMALAFGGMLPARAQSTVNVVKYPYLLWVTETGATVMWETDTAAAATVTFSPPSGSATVVNVPATDTVEKAIATSLTRATRYTYSVDIPGKHLGDGAFTTDDHTATKVTFGVIGDNRTNPANFLNLNTRMMRRNPELIINVGDVVTSGPVVSQWNTEFFTPSKDVFRFAPCYVSIGNHEGNTPLFRRFLPYPETITGNPVESRGHYFAHYRGNCAFVAFDDYYSLAPGSPQYVWLQQTLASPAYQNAKWKFAYCHEPAYSDGWPGYDGTPDVRNYIVPLLEKAGVDAFFNGHTHSYERAIVNNVVHMINGGGGAGDESWGRNWPQTVKYGLILQYSTVQVDGDNMTVTCYDDSNKVFDRLTLRKGDARTLPGAPVFVRPPVSGHTGRQMVTLKYPSGSGQRYRYRVAIKERTTEDGFWEPTIVMYDPAVAISLPVDFKVPGTYHVMAQALDAQYLASGWVESGAITIQ